MHYLVAEVDYQYQLTKNYYSRMYLLLSYIFPKLHLPFPFRANTIIYKKGEMLIWNSVAFQISIVGFSSIMSACRVLHICVSFWLLAHESHDLSQITCWVFFFSVWFENKSSFLGIFFWHFVSLFSFWKSYFCLSIRF